jgi:hypothetical protein
VTSVPAPDSTDVLEELGRALDDLLEVSECLRELEKKAALGVEKAGGLAEADAQALGEAIGALDLLAYELSVLRVAKEEDSPGLKLAEGILETTVDGLLEPALALLKSLRGDPNPRGRLEECLCHVLEKQLFPVSLSLLLAVHLVNEETWVGDAN